MRKVKCGMECAESYCGTVGKAIMEFRGVISLRLHTATSAIHIRNAENVFILNILQHYPKTSI